MAKNLITPEMAALRPELGEAFIANQRFADYLDMKPSGAFGSVEIPGGKTATDELLSGSCI